MTAAVTISSEDGSISIAGYPLSLGAGISRADVTTGMAGLFLNYSDFRNGYAWHRLHNISFGGQPCVLALCFHLDRLDQSQFSVILPTGSGSGDDEDAEEIAFVRSELRRQLGRSFASGCEEFSWGSAWSSYDPKSSSASSGLRYVNKNRPDSNSGRRSWSSIAQSAALLIAIVCVLVTAWALEDLTDLTFSKASAINIPGWLIALLLVTLSRPFRRRLVGLTLVLAAIEIVLVSFAPKAFVLSKERRQRQLQEMVQPSLLATPPPE